MTPKRPRDPNQLAKSIIDIATGEKSVKRQEEPSGKPEKEKRTKTPEESEGH